MAQVATRRKKIAVIGAGIVGVSTAEWLRRDGHDVVLIDRNDPGADSQTSYGNGGILARCAVVPVVVPGIWKKAPRMLFSSDGPLFLRWSYLPKLLPWLVPYLLRSSPAQVAKTAAGLAPLLDDAVEQHLALARGTPAQKWIVPGDYMYLYRSRGDFLADDFGWSLRRDHGITGDEMTRGDLESYDPGLGPRYQFGYRLSNHGHISNPGQYVKDLAGWFTSQGGTFLRAEVDDIKPQQEGIEISHGTGVMTADRVVIASGVWSSKLAAQLGHKAMMESERGYHTVFSNPSHQPACPYMVADSKFVATAMGNDVRAAGIVEFGGLNAGPSRNPPQLLARGMTKLYPSFHYDSSEQWFGHRPSTIDSLPLLGGSPTHQSIYFAFGHHHVGMTAGPKSGRLIADMISGRKPNIDLTPYRVDRFA